MRVTKEKLGSLPSWVQISQHAPTMPGGPHATMPNVDEDDFVLDSCITCLLCGTSSKAEPVKNRLMRAVIVVHVAFDAIPSGVPVTSFPSCFSFSCPWHLFSVPVSACFVSTKQIATLATTCFAQPPLSQKPCVLYGCRFSWSGCICWICRGAGCVCPHELILLGLPFTKSKVFHNFLF
jgi:hypothetical protein